MVAAVIFCFFLDVVISTFEPLRFVEANAAAGLILVTLGSKDSLCFLFCCRLEDILQIVVKVSEKEKENELVFFFLFHVAFSS